MHKLVIQVLRRRREEGRDCKANLEYMIPCLQKKVHLTILLGIGLCPPPNSVWCPSSNVTIFGNRGFREVIKVKWDHINGTII